MVEQGGAELGHRKEQMCERQGKTACVFHPSSPPWDLSLSMEPLCTPMDNSRHIEVCEKLGRALFRDIGLLVDSRPLAPRHLVNRIPVKRPPPPSRRLLCSLCPCFKKRLMLSKMSHRTWPTQMAKCFATWHPLRTDPWCAFETQCCSGQIVPVF